MLIIGIKDFSLTEKIIKDRQAIVKHKQYLSLSLANFVDGVCPAYAGSLASESEEVLKMIKFDFLRGILYTSHHEKDRFCQSECL
jgi:hypothetical protein